MAETETAFNPLETETHEVSPQPGIKQPGTPLETHDLTLSDSHLIELDLDQYMDDFNRRVIGAYQDGQASTVLPADLGAARSLIPAGTGALRDFSYIGPEIPVFEFDKCVGCMTCVTLCPDTAILAKAIPATKVAAALEKIEDAAEREWVGGHWSRTRKYFDLPQKKGEEGALFGIFIDPTKCKGCAECVQVCDELDYHALKMTAKDERTLPRYRVAFNFFRRIGPTPPSYINERALADLMLAEERALLYVGGAGSCMGCGEATAIE
jgi:ferredoxin